MSFFVDKNFLSKFFYKEYYNNSVALQFISSLKTPLLALLYDRN